MAVLLVGGFFLVIAALSALGWVADSRDREPRPFFAAPRDRSVRRKKRHFSIECDHCCQSGA
jgi:hypothetical protein